MAAVEHSQPLPDAGLKNWWPRLKTYFQELDTAVATRPTAVEVSAALGHQVAVTDNGDGTGKITPFASTTVTDNGDGTGKITF